jgi:hypothetical protein
VAPNLHQLRDLPHLPHLAGAEMMFAVVKLLAIDAAALLDVVLALFAVAIKHCEDIDLRDWPGEIQSQPTPAPRDYSDTNGSSERILPNGAEDQIVKIAPHLFPIITSLHHYIITSLHHYIITINTYVTRSKQKKVVNTHYI